MPKSLIYLSPKSQIPPKLLPFLTDTGSLTAKFEALSGQKLLVKSQFEGRQRLTKNDIRRLNFNHHRLQSAWVREALLYGEPNDKAWVLARSVFPFSSLTGNAKQLANLGSKPIGYVIFGRNGATVQQRWIQLTEDGWQRISLYDWQGRKLLISETFLPQFEAFLITNSPK